MEAPHPTDPRHEQSPRPSVIEMVPCSGASEAARSWCIGLHLSGFSGILLGWSLMHILAPLAIWLIKRSDSPEIDTAGKEVLNFQISYTIYMLIAGALGGASVLLCLALVGFLFLPLILILMGVIWCFWLILMIVAAVKVSNGGAYRYPFTIRFLK